MRLMVTGGAGFIGSNFVRYWIKKHPADKVVVYDALTYAGTLTSLADLEGSYRFVHGDIADSEAVGSALREHKTEVVVNFAAESHNSLAIIDPGRFFRTNVMGTQGLLEACRHSDIERFHHVSTCEVYGDLDLDSPHSFTESSPYLPRTPYNASKAGADHAVRAYYLTYDVPISITNCSNNYGRYQFPEKVIPLFVTNALDDKPLPLYASTQNRREWIHALDHSSAIEAVIRRGRVGETYHVGTGIEKSIEEIADLVIEALSKPASLKTIVPDRPSHDRRYLLDSSKIRAELGWEPEVGFEDGLRDVIEWYALNRSWWEPLKANAPVVEGQAWAKNSS
jgi:dTDP-glucose 4,6-dehydratase